MRAYLMLHNAQQAHRELLSLWADIKPWLVAGHRLEVQVKPARRSSEQNAKFHAICSDLHRSGLLWGGKPRDEAAWKVLLVSGHAMATKEGVDIVPGIENEFVNLRESTALMSVARGSSLIEYSLAFCAASNVRLSEPVMEMERIG